MLSTVVKFYIRKFYKECDTLLINADRSCFFVKIDF